MADDNSQDYEGYDRVTKGELYDTPRDPENPDSEDRFDDEKQGTDNG